MLRRHGVSRPSALLCDLLRRLFPLPSLLPLCTLLLDKRPQEVCPDSCAVLQEAALPLPNPISANNQQMSSVGGEWPGCPVGVRETNVLRGGACFFGGRAAIAAF